MAVAKKFYVVIFALFFLLAIPSAHATSTWVQGLYRFQPWADYIGGGILVVADQPALLTDWSVAIRILISYPSDGDRWGWEYYSPNGSVSRISQIFSASLNGQLGCFLTVGIYPAPPPGCAGTVVIVADITAFAIKRIQCEVPGNWRAVLKFTPGGSTIAQTLFDQPFTLASIGPVVNVALNPKEIHPKVNGGGTPPIPNVDAETSHINALVTDSGCPNIPIPDAKVELSSKVIPGSGGHAHIKTELAGTGTFKSGRSSGLTVSGISDLYGKFQATYTAGDLGIKENIIARATVTDSQGMTKTVEGKSELSITVATKTPITPLPAMSPFYVLQQGEEGANNHPQNNYGRPRLNQVIQSVASAFKSYRQKETQQTTVTLLSINDISLPLGGRFEGHGSHEVGVELDINGAASGLAPDSRDYRKLIKLFDGQQCTEIHFIHFRCEKTY